MVTSWQVEDQDLLYLDQPRFANPALSVRGGIPILFPICGNLPDDTYTYRAQTFHLKQHGFARDLAWKVEDQTSTSLALALHSNAETLKAYPFDFQVLFTYKLINHSLEIHQRYTNLSAAVMPFSTGLHPYFCVNDKTGLQFSVPATEMWDKITDKTVGFPGSFDLERDEIDAALRPLTAQAASVTDPSRNLKITLSYDSNYSTLVFWAVKGKDFYCLEPWSAPRNALNTSEDLLHLEPNKSLETLVTLSAQFGQVE